MSVIERMNKRKKRDFVMLELEEPNTSEKSLRYLRMRMMTSTIAD